MSAELARTIIKKNNIKKNLYLRQLLVQFMSSQTFLAAENLNN